jgi:hypothetical protein
MLRQQQFNKDTVVHSNEVQKQGWTVSHCCYELLVKAKVKVKFSLCLTKHYDMRAYWGSGGIAPRILDLGTRWK